MEVSISLKALKEPNRIFQTRKGEKNEDKQGQFQRQNKRGRDSRVFVVIRAKQAFCLEPMLEQKELQPAVRDGRQHPVLPES